MLFVKENIEIRGKNVKLKEYQKLGLKALINKYQEEARKELGVTEEKIDKFVNKDFQGLEFIMIMLVLNKLRLV